MGYIDAEDQLLRRNRRTMFLILAGAACLLVPLAGLLYIRLSETPVSTIAGSVTHPFERRASPIDRSRPAMTPAPSPDATPSAANSSLMFVKGGNEFYPSAQKPSPPPAEAPAAAAANPTEPAPVPDTAAEISPPKAAAKTVARPRLQRGKFGASSFGSFNDPKGTQGAPQNGQTPAGAPDVSNMLKNLPGTGGATGAGMPDMSGLLKGLPGAGSPTNQTQRH